MIDVNVISKNGLTPLHVVVRSHIIKFHEQADVLVQVSNFYQEKKLQVRIAEKRLLKKISNI